MNKTQLEHFMDKTQLYHEAYLKAYSQSDNSSKTAGSTKNVFSILVYISLPLILTIVLNFFLLIDKSSDPKTTFNFSDEIIYKNIFENDLFFHNNYDMNEFEKITQNYKNDLSNKFELFNKVIPPTNSISLKEINLLSNISKRKKEFINIVLPLIIDQNRNIIVLRQKLIDSRNYLNQNKTLNQTDRSFIKDLASKYSVSTKNRHKIDIINDLLISIDIIPNSIALAQAANESGWGSSRFATEYNALFGEYTYDNKIGIIPYQREEGKKHLVKYFTTIDKSVESYFTNINSHYAYSKFRKLRKTLRDQNNSFNVNLLVNKLDVYAEDDKYVDNIVSIIHNNKLTQYDSILYLLTKS